MRNHTKLDRDIREGKARWDARCWAYDTQYFAILTRLRNNASTSDFRDRMQKRLDDLQAKYPGKPLG